MSQTDQISPRKVKKAPKVRVLHTRIPEVLEHELKRAADGLRVSVSNLVRTILEDALALQEGQSSAQPDPLEGVFGFREFLLAVPTHCTACGGELGVGERAFLGVRDGPGPRVVIGSKCLPKPSGVKDD